MLKLKFLGGVQEVGRSSTLLETSSNILIDCGLKQEISGTSYPRLEEIENESIDSVILTHAHVDHIGALPLLFVFNKLKEGARIYCTAPTASLLDVLLWDSHKIQKLEWKTKGKTPLYGEKEIREVLSSLFIVGYDSFKINGVRVKFGDAGHILGSGWVYIETEGIGITFSGDLGEGRSNHLKIPERPPRTDVLILESTYGAITHRPKYTEVQNEIMNLLSGDVSVLVPVEAVGKSMEVMRLIAQRKRGGFPLGVVWYDGMICDMIPIYSGFSNSVYMNKSVSNEVKTTKTFNPFLKGGDFNTPRTLSQREEIIRESNSKVLAPSGMLKGGFSPYYLRKFVESKENGRILLLGYQAEGTPGRVLQEAKGGDVRVDFSSPVIENEENITWEKFSIKVPSDWIYHIEGFSLHATAPSLLEFARMASPSRILLVHGDLESSVRLRDSLSRDKTLRYSDPTIPNLGENFEFEGKSSPLEEKVTSLEEKVLELKRRIEILESRKKERND